MEYNLVFSILNSEDSDDVFGAINYMLCNYRERFMIDVNNGICTNVATNIIFQYFRKDIQIEL